MLVNQLWPQKTVNCKGVQAASRRSLCILATGISAQLKRTDSVPIFHEGYLQQQQWSSQAGAVVQRNMVTFDLPYFWRCGLEHIVQQLTWPTDCIMCYMASSREHDRASSAKWSGREHIPHTQAGTKQMQILLNVKRA